MIVLLASIHIVFLGLHSSPGETKKKERNHEQIVFPLLHHKSLTLENSEIKAIFKQGVLTY